MKRPEIHVRHRRYRPDTPGAYLITLARVRRVGEREVMRVAFRGAVVEATAERFRSFLEHCGARLPHLVVDLTEVTELGPAGRDALLAQAHAQERRGGWLRVVTASGPVLRILSSPEFAAHLPASEHEDEALSDLTPHAA